jgi:hypothetical protein
VIANFFRLNAAGFGSGCCNENLQCQEYSAVVLLKINWKNGCITGINEVKLFGKGKITILCVSVLAFFEVC